MAQLHSPQPLQCLEGRKYKKSIFQWLSIMLLGTFSTVGRPFYNEERAHIRVLNIELSFRWLRCILVVWVLWLRLLWLMLGF